MVTPRYEPSIGGVETHVREAGRRLAARGHAVTVIAADPDHEMPVRADALGMTVRRVRTWPRGSDLMLAPGLPAVMAAVRADVVHVQSYNTLIAPTALAAAWRTGRPAVLTFHSGGHSSAVRRAIRGLQLLALRPLVRQARALVAVSQFEADVLAARLRLRRSRFTVIPNGSDLSASGPDAPETPDGRDEQPDLIVSLGRLEAYKGHEHAIRAVGTLRSHRPGVRLQIVGRGPDETRLRNLAAELGLAEAVGFASIPVDDRAAMASLLSGAGAVAVLSSYESQGIAATEAVSAGARVLVRDDTALSELVRLGWAAGVAPGADPGTIAAALDELLARPRRAPVAVPRVPTWDETVDRLEALYDQVAWTGGP
jgi:glycosyltransferase involved in cell wall biosynthesis